MTFIDNETSTQDGAPIELYVFTGTYNTYRLTNHGRDIVNSDGTYDSQWAITRGDEEFGTQADDDINLDISLDAGHPMIQEYAINIPPPDLTLQVFRAHPQDLDDTFLLFEGEVVSWSIEGRVAKARVPSIFSFLFDSPLPRVKYQAPCNHTLGDEFCQVDMTDPANSHDTTITAIDGTTITVASNPFPDGECNAGEMIAPQERRMVSSNTGLVFNINFAFSNAVQVSDAITLRRGCDHALNGDCINRYNNAINYFGTVLVPTRNPFNSRL